MIAVQADSLTAVGVNGYGKATEAIPMQADSLTAVGVDVLRQGNKAVKKRQKGNLHVNQA